MARQAKQVIDGKQQCSACGGWKPLGEFGPSKVAKAGRQSHCMRCSNLKRLYGIDSRQYDALLSAQGGKCAICGEAPKASAMGRNRTETATLVVDHDHATGSIRGLLCHPCNTAIGLMRDNTERLAAAIHYLQAGGVQKAEAAA